MRNLGILTLTLELHSEPLAPIITWGISQFAENPVPGGPDFEALEPGGDIANYPDRWDWITHSGNGMWPLWVGTSLNTQLQWVEVPLTTYANNFIYIPPLIQ